jgi:hypothetical protein
MSARGLAPEDQIKVLATISQGAGILLTSNEVVGEGVGEGVAEDDAAAAAQ